MLCKVLFCGKDSLKNIYRNVLGFKSSSISLTDKPWSDAGNAQGALYIIINTESRGWLERNHRAPGSLLRKASGDQTESKKNITNLAAAHSLSLSHAHSLTHKMHSWNFLLLRQRIGHLNRTHSSKKNRCDEQSKNTNRTNRWDSSCLRT